MKNILLIISILLSSKISTSQTDTVVKLFRTTHLSGKNKIVMAANIESLKNITIKDNDNFYHLKKDSYSVADSIWLEVNDAKKIIGIYFGYQYEPEFSNDTAYIHELHKYQKVMNSPGKEYVETANGRTIRITKWEEPTTRFELVELTDNGKKKVYSVIFDNSLYFKKVKSKIDLKKNNTCIELLKWKGSI